MSSFARVDRWPSRDPIGERGGGNLYAFVRNNPIQWKDPLGLEIRLYGGSAWGNPYLVHEFYWSTVENSGVGENGSLGKTLGNGVPPIFNPDKTLFPYVTIDTHGLTDWDFLDLVGNDTDLNGGLYFPYVHDCHTAARSAYHIATGYDLKDPFPRVTSFWGALGTIMKALTRNLPVAF